MNKNVEDQRIREMIDALDRNRIDERDRALMSGLIADQLDDQDDAYDMVGRVIAGPANNTMSTIGDVFDVSNISSDISSKMYEKLTNKGLSTKNQRVVIDGSKYVEPDCGEPYYLLVAERANDQITDRRLCGSFLVNDMVKTQNGKNVNVKHDRYSPEQYQTIMNGANCDGDRPVINADLQVNPYGPGQRIVSNSVSRPDLPFDAEKHKTMLKQAYVAREYEQKLRADAREIKQFENDKGREL